MATDTPHDPTPAKTAKNEPGSPSPSSALTREAAGRLVDKLLSGYPSLKNLHDPEGYIVNLASLLMEYDPRDAEAGAVSCGNVCEFPPTRYELRVSCEVAAARRIKLERLKSIPAPQARIATEKPADPLPGPDGRHPPGTILADYGAAVAIYGRPIGRFEPGREKP
jgi:hypothetical protein